MRAAIVGAVLLAVGAAGPARADRGFQVYEGVDAVRIGSGGTKVINDGLEIWTAGEPPRSYQVLGLLTDNRTGLFRGNALTSKALAGRIRNAGGDAAIMLDREQRTQWFLGSPAQQTETQFLVIRYLPDGAVVEAPEPTP